MDDAGSNPVRGAKGTYTPEVAEYLKLRYRAKMDEAIAFLGGKCVECGSVDQLEIDHIDRSTKTATVSKLWSMRRDTMLEELTKCQLLCGGCHQNKTSSELTVGHGGGLTGVRNCYCELCKPLKARYMASKSYNQNRCRKKVCGCEKKHYR